MEFGISQGEKVAMGVPVEELSEAKGEREDLGSQKQAGRAQGLADGAEKSS